MSRIDAFWASFFGLSLVEFVKPGLSIVPHARLHGYSGAWLFRRDSSLIVSTPPAWVAPLRAALNTASAVTDLELMALFGGAVERTIGPAYQGHLEPRAFRPAGLPVRLLSADDDALSDLAAACETTEWEHSAIHAGGAPIFGCFVGGRLVAVSNYRMEARDAALPGVIVHPHARGRGYGKAVLSAASEHALESGFLVLYQTLLSNKPAVAAAESLGYRQYAVHLAVRLRS